MRSLKGANCADLPPAVIDKYFYCDVRRQPLQAMAALAICSNCPVQLECRDEALNMSGLQTRGVIGGRPAVEIRNARRWRSYEEGITSIVPNVARPDWLPLSEAAEAAEDWRLLADPDEPLEYRFDAEEDAAVPFSPRPLPHLPTPQRGEAERHATGASSKAAVPMPLEGANCAAMPLPLVDRYFHSDVQREPTHAALAMLVCDNCDAQEQCRGEVLRAGSVPESGVIAGLGAREVRRGRAWLRFEAGWSNAAPRAPRPSWLPPPSDAAAATGPGESATQGNA